MKDQTREEPKILAAAERQMQAWVLTQEIEDRAIRSQRHGRPAEGVGLYVALSRETGAGGGQVAQLVGQELGWEVLDQNILDRVAERFRLSRSMLELVDETESNWVYDVLGTWMDRRVIPHDKYVSYLGRVVLAAAERGNVVAVGRGAQFILSREKGLTVRIIAPKKYRIEQIMQREGLNNEDARRFVERTDHGRREFVRRFFHRDVDDPHLYDLVINVERVAPVGAAEQILAALCR